MHNFTREKTDVLVKTTKKVYLLDPVVEYPKKHNKLPFLAEKMKSERWRTSTKS